MVDCSILVADFRFLSDFEKMIASNPDWSRENRPGTLLKMLLYQTEDLPVLQKTLFRHYVRFTDFPQLFAKSWLKNFDEKQEDLPLHDLVFALTDRLHSFEDHSESKLAPKSRVKVSKILQNTHEIHLLFR